jgi:hypothetical protein
MRDEVARIIKNGNVAGSTLGHLVGAAQIKHTELFKYGGIKCHAAKGIEGLTDLREILLQKMPS